MSSTISYASLAVVELLAEGEVAIETVSVTSDTCDLSGAWLISNEQIKEISQILEGRLLVIIGNRTKAEEIFMDNLRSEVAIQEFVVEANRDASSAIKAFENYIFLSNEAYTRYMSINPIERKLLPKVVKKKLIHPEFYAWPSEIDVTRPHEFLSAQRKISDITGTDLKLKNVLATARLIKFLVDKWQGDEIERKNRLYVNETEAIVSILPNCWLTRIPI